jgi:hypothetical protein
MTVWNIEPPAHPPKPADRTARSRPVWLGAVAVAVAVVMLVAGLLIGAYVLGGGGHADDAALADATAKVGELAKALADSEDRNSMYYRQNQALQVELEDLRGGSQDGATASSTTLPDVQEQYADGVYLVGEDILSGTYDGVVTREVGYWARLSATDGSTHAIIANALPRGPFVLTILPADKAVELRGVEITIR